MNFLVIHRKYGTKIQGVNYMERLTLSVTEAAEILGVSRSFMYQLVKENKIPSLKLGNRRLIPKGNLEEWIRKNTEN